EPVSPEQPVAPEQPVVTEQPVSPEQPVAPVEQMAPVEPVSPEQPVAAEQPLAPVVHQHKKGHLLGIMLGLIAVFAILGIGFSVFLFLPAGQDLLGSLGYGQVVAYALAMIILGLVGTLSLVGGLMGLFKLLTAKKEDKPAKKKGFTLALVAALAFLLAGAGFIVSFVGFNGLSTGPANIADSVITEPTELRSLTAPVEIVFDASQVPYNSAEFEVISYLWAFGDGSNATGSKVTHKFNRKPDTGVYNVSLTINYRNLATNEEVKQVIQIPVGIENQQAIIDFTISPDYGSTPITITFDASQSEDPDGEIVAYEWDFNADGTIDAEGVIVEHEFLEDGEYQITLNVTDTNGETTKAVKPLSLSAEGGFSIKFSLQPDDAPLRANIGYQFDATATAAPENGKLTQYTWNFGDNSGTQSGRKVTHSYRNEGIYTLTLTVFTETGQTQTKEFPIQVGDLNTSPNALITSVPAAVGGSINGSVPLTVKFSANDSTDPNKDIVEFSWDFDGDGISDALGGNAEHTYTDTGEYLVVLTLTDADGNKDTAEAKVSVGERGVQARLSANPIAGEAPLAVSFDASGTTTDPSDPVVTFEWNFGDNTPVRRDNAQITYVYKQIGTYTATLTAITGSGKKSTAQTVINVNPVSLKACFTMSRKTGAAPVTVQFSSKCTRGVVSGTKWNFGDGKESIERDPVHTFDTPGTYTIKLEVQKDNVIDSFSDIVEVRVE
ncbi:hypothetical protein COV81_01080, partial [Candidatus Peregrinibacteria bacterium CG11_big_fil_rev_8_21_14_0_20_41_10]